MRKIRNWFGFYKIDYGFACGRHWIETEGKIIAQTLGDDVWMRDADVSTLIRLLDK